MELFGTVFLAAAPVFIILFAGGFARRAGILDASAEGNLIRLIINLFYPALILRFVLGNPALQEASNLIWPPLVGFFTTVMGFALAWVTAPLLGLKIGQGQRTFAFTTGMYNYGFIPIPLIASLFNDKGTLGVLLVHNVGIEVALWSVGLLLVSGNLNRQAWKKIVNPPLIALMGALFVNALEPGEWSGWALHGYNVFYEAISMVGACAVPTGILVAGATLGGLIGEKGWAREWKVISGALSLRLLLLPLLMLSMALVLPVSAELKKIMLVQAAMPAALLPIALATHYGGSPRVAVQVVLSTTLVSLVTIPLWISLGLLVLDL